MSFVNPLFTESIFWALLTLTWGLVNIFWGYRIFRLFLAVSGAFIGAQIAHALLPQINPTFYLILIIAAAILTSLLAYSLYSIAFILLGALTGLMLTYTVSHYFLFPNYLLLLMLIFGLLIGALFGSVIGDLIIIVATVVGGTTLALYGAELLLPHFPSLTPLASTPNLTLIAWIALLLIGTITQLNHYSPHT
jgi:hypothetical protein